MLNISDQKQTYSFSCCFHFRSSCLSFTTEAQKKRHLAASMKRPQASPAALVRTKRKQAGRGRCSRWSAVQWKAAGEVERQREREKHLISTTAFHFNLCTFQTKTQNYIKKQQQNDKNKQQIMSAMSAPSRGWVWWKAVKTTDLSKKFFFVVLKVFINVL